MEQKGCRGTLPDNGIMRHARNNVHGAEAQRQKKRPGARGERTVEYGVKTVTVISKNEVTRNLFFGVVEKTRFLTFCEFIQSLRRKMTVGGSGIQVMDFGLKHKKTIDCNKPESMLNSY